MKKLKISLLTLLVMMFCLTGCSKKFAIEVDPSASGFRYLSKSELSEKLTNKDSFVLLISDPMCGACLEFKEIGESTIVANNLVIYAIDIVSEGLKKDNDLVSFSSTPTLVIFNEGKEKEKIDYASDPKVFSSSTNFLNFLKKYVTISKPKIEGLNVETIDEMIANKGTFIVYFMRPTCGDCSAFSTHFLDQFTKENKNKFYFTFDIDPYRPSVSQSDEPELYQEQIDAYNALKDKYGLSVAGNPQFGYQTGVVPTFQYYEKGVLTDMAVIYNDITSGNSDQLTIVSSYFPDAPFIGQTFLRQDENTSARDVYKAETASFYADKTKALFARLYK